MPFVFANWSTECLQIASMLLPFLCQKGSGLYPVRHQREQLSRQVRAGWPNPNSEDNQILAVLTPKGEQLEMELRVGRGKVAEKLFPPFYHKKDESQRNQDTKGFITLNAGEPLPTVLLNAFRIAYEYTTELYSL
jgi:hypothetical protein